MSNRFRQQRHALLMGMLSALPGSGDPSGTGPVTILDVGGTAAYWLRYGYPERSHITLLNQDATPDINLCTWGAFAYCQGDACAMPQFADRQFDLVFSNSVIEHVSSWSRQRAMAQEVQRIGRAFFVQTPAFSFPIEPHYRLPFVHFLPLSARLAVARLGVKLGFYPPRAPRTYGAIRLLTATEMQTLFPEATLWRERVPFGRGPLTKSFVAYSVRLI